MTSRVGRRLEALPPFWVALGLTLPVGAGLLALPIALAGIGAVPGIVLLIIFGLLNALTAAALAESVARSGTTRFGLGFVGQLVSEYLGNAGSVLLTVIMAIDNFLVLIVFYMGVAGTLEGALRLPAELVDCRDFCRRTLFPIPQVAQHDGLFGPDGDRDQRRAARRHHYVRAAVHATCQPGLQPGSLRQWTTFNPAVWTLVFGVMLSNFFSHMLIANYGKVIIRRDASARSWISGVVAAIGVTTLISCLWVVTFNGAVSPEVLARKPAPPSLRWQQRWVRR